MLRLCFLFAFCIVQSILSAQDAWFNQWNALPMQINPAFAGTKFCDYGPAAGADLAWQFNAAKKEQFFGVGYDLHVPPAAGGIGGQFTSAQYGNGLVRMNVLKASYSYWLRLWRWALHVGFQPGIEQKIVDPSQAIYLSGIKENFALPDSLGTKELRLNYFTFGTGFLIRKDRRGNMPFSFGFSLLNIGSSNWALPGQPRILKPLLYIVHGYRVFWMNKAKRRELSANALYRHQNVRSDFIGGITMIKSGISLGINYRYLRENGYNQNMVQGVIGYRRNGIDVGYNSQYNLTGLSSTNKLAHLVFLRITYCRPASPRPMGPGHDIY